MTIKYDRLMNVKPGSMPVVMEMGPKFPELAKKILGEEYAGSQILLEGYGSLESSNVVLGS